MQMLTKECDGIPSSGINSGLYPSSVLWSDQRGDVSVVDDATGNPYIRNGNAIEFMPELMVTDQPYPVKFAGCWFVAVKRLSGSLDFLYVK